MTQTRSKKQWLLPLLLAACMVLVALFPVGVQAAADTGYSNMLRYYTITGVDKDPNTIALGYLYGVEGGADNYAMVIKMQFDREEVMMDVMSGADFQRMMDNSLSVTTSSVDNMNEYLLTMGVPDEYLFLNEKPYALREIEKGLAAGESVIKVQDATAVFPDTLAYAAQRGGSNLRISFDTIYYGSVDVRITVNPSTATKGIITEAFVVDYVGNPSVEMFQRLYTNTFASIAFFQEGSFGTTVQVAAKTDLAGLNTGSLVFYNYNPITNTFYQMENVEYSVDGGYLYFGTDVGNYVLITDRALQKR